VDEEEEVHTYFSLYSIKGGLGNLCGRGKGSLKISFIAVTYYLPMMSCRKKYRVLCMVIMGRGRERAETLWREFPLVVGKLNPFGHQKDFLVFPSCQKLWK